MRIRTANGIGLVRLVVALVIAIVVVSGNAFGQQKQRGKVVVPSVSKKANSVQQPIPREPEMRTQGEEVKVPAPLPSGWIDYGDPGGNGGYNPWPFLPGVNPFPSSGGNAPIKVLYEDVCSCPKTESYTIPYGSKVTGLAPEDIKSAISQLPRCELNNSLASESHTEYLSYKISDYVTPGAQQSAHFMCAHGTIASYELIDNWTYTHCAIPNAGSPANAPAVTFSWTITYRKSGETAQSDMVTSFGRCPR